MGVTVSVGTMEIPPSEFAGHVADFGSHLQDRAFEIDAWTLIDEGGILMEVSRETIDLEVETYSGKPDTTSERAEAVRKWVDQIYGDKMDTYLLLSY